MLYLKSFSLASDFDEDCYFVPQKNRGGAIPYCKSNQSTYGGAYPFNLFPQKGLERLEFAPVTLIYGGNGSGKSTLLNVIAQKLHLARRAPFNATPFYDDYLFFCSYEPANGKSIPGESRIVTSDDVFDYMLDLRAINEGVDRKREDLFGEYKELHGYSCGFQIKSLADYDELKKRIEADKMTKNAYAARHNPQNVRTKSNGESAFSFFTDTIGESALYLLDEPENSLAAPLQKELADYIADSARFCQCQFIISTHSPFLLAMRDALIYDLDSDDPEKPRKWTELPNVLAYKTFFDEHRNDFK